MSIKRGDILKRDLDGIPGVFYSHYGIAVSHNRVIHVYKPNGDASKHPDDGDECRLDETDLDSFSPGGRKIFVEEQERRKYTHEETAANAIKKMGELSGRPWDYSLRYNNCEHFTTWCWNGQHISSQVNSTELLVKIGGSIAAFNGYSNVSSIAFTISPVQQQGNWIIPKIPGDPRFPKSNENIYVPIHDQSLYNSQKMNDFIQMTIPQPHKPTEKLKTINQKNQPNKRPHSDTNKPVKNKPVKNIPTKKNNIKPQKKQKLRQNK